MHFLALGPIPSNASLTIAAAGCCILLQLLLSDLVVRGVSQEMGGRRLAKKPLGDSRLLDLDVGGLGFASQLRDVGGFVFKENFHQSKDIKLTQIKQYQV